MTIDSKEIRRLMEQRGFNTIVDFAIASGVHRNTVSEILNGQRPNPTLDTINKIAKTLRVDPKKILIGG